MFTNANSPRQLENKEPLASARIDKSHMVNLFSLDWQLDYIWDMTGTACTSLRVGRDAFDLVKWGDPVSGCVNVMSSSGLAAVCLTAAEPASPPASTPRRISSFGSPHRQTWSRRLTNRAIKTIGNIQICTSNVPTANIGIYSPIKRGADDRIIVPLNWLIMKAVLFEQRAEHHFFTCRKSPRIGQQIVNGNDPVMII